MSLKVVKDNDPSKKFTEKLTKRLAQKAEREKVKKLAIKEFPTIKHLVSGIRYIEIFAQLMKLKQFVEWMKEHIELHDQVNEKTEEITTFVTYKNFNKKPETSPDQNIVKCPNCQATFDANVTKPLIQLASEMPKE